MQFLSPKIIKKLYFQESKSDILISSSNRPMYSLNPAVLSIEPIQETGGYHIAQTENPATGRIQPTEKFIES